ncbi:MAG TPA: hypothetical protein VK099_03955 [Alcanivoracaceae bacterium]|nr:hypothetical protein [Alcanivoracaceae bacterium]
MQTMQRYIFTLTLTLCVLAAALFNTAMANDKDGFTWEIISDHDQILVHQAAVAGSKINVYRATTIMELDDLQALIALLQDYSHYPRWLHFITNSTKVAQISALEQLIHVRTLVPWPAKNREAILHTSFEHTLGNEHTNERLEYRFHIAEEPFSAAQGYRQFTRFDGFIRAVVKEENKVVLSYQLHADFGGRIKPWLNNRMLRNAPYFTLDKMRLLLHSPMYRQLTPQEN